MRCSICNEKIYFWQRIAPYSIRETHPELALKDSYYAAHRGCVVRVDTDMVNAIYLGKKEKGGEQ